jgi:hypothetical protein
MFIRKLTDNIIEVITSGSPVVLFEYDQRTFVKWIAENRPDIIRDIFCKECPEHKDALEAQEHSRFCLNERESTHR